MAVSVGVICDAAPFSLMEADFETLPFFAVRVTVSEETTDATLAAKVALVPPEGMVTEAGTLIAPLLLASVATNPVLGAAALIFTVQLSVPAPVIELLAQTSPESDAGFCEPLPCSLIEFAVLVAFVTAAMFSSPLASVVVPGSNRTCATRVPPAGSLAGKVPAFTVKALLELTSCSTSTASSL